MKLIPFIAGFALTYIGYEKLTSTSPEQIGWLLAAVGVVFILSSFSTSKDKTRVSIELSNDDSGGGGSSDGGGGD
ncbi:MULTISPECIES: hypothetical protein [unclassified Pseudoalteromonas]|uniref:hypothetical protein n=1 Tax=unclassified Pseudoalteromonas TaxID=194690 RepID=UPI00209763A9|nr:hypothetical protein [Pseudoalteromonas sp. XMcav2-N]MCO7189104.1 hypothetical protein [Pseudoalteromonas sp. XMcav2-N]